MSTVVCLGALPREVIERMFLAGVVLPELLAIDIEHHGATARVQLVDYPFAFSVATS